MKNLILLLASLLSTSAFASSTDIVEIKPDNSSALVSFCCGTEADPAAALLYSAINSPVDIGKYGTKTKQIGMEGILFHCSTGSHGMPTTRCTVTLGSGPNSFISAAEKKVHFELKDEAAAHLFALFTLKSDESELHFVTADRNIEIHSSARHFTFSYVAEN